MVGDFEDILIWVLFSDTCQAGECFFFKFDVTAPDNPFLFNLVDAIGGKVVLIPDHNALLGSGIQFKLPLFLWNERIGTASEWSERFKISLSTCPRFIGDFHATSVRRSEVGELRRGVDGVRPEHLGKFRLY